MAAGKQMFRMSCLLGLLAVLASSPSAALEPAFSQDGANAARDIKVCILLLSATGWENPEPFFLPTLATETFQKVRSLRPSNWNLINPLAPTVVTPEIQALWDVRLDDATVVFDGVSGDVDNDYAGNGNDTQADINENQGLYNGGGGNVGGPNEYKAHCQPVHLQRYGRKYGTSGTLPDVGRPVPRTHPAYWEVPLTPKTVSQLANFDAVFVNTHRNLRFSAQEQVLLRQFLDQGGTLFLEDSHGCRVETIAGGDKTNPADVDFFLPFQFVDGFPYATGTAGTRPDGYPVNRGGVTTLSPSKDVINPNHPLFNVLHKLTAGDCDMLGDVRARDHLILRNSPAIYLTEELLRTRNNDVSWGRNNTVGVREPALAVARIGSGKLILSGNDMIDDCSKPYEANSEPTPDQLPDIKFMFNLLAWRGSLGGNRRGGANNHGVAASTPPSTLLPRTVWSFPEGGIDAAAFQQTDGRIDAETFDLAEVSQDPHLMLSEPLCAANGIAYLQYQYGGAYYLIAVDARPDTDLDGDGSVDDGIRDVSLRGSTSDTIWYRDVGAYPLVGATVVSITHAAKNVPIDVLVATQYLPTGASGGSGDGEIHLYALHATVDNYTNQQLPVAGPVVESAGQGFYNWIKTPDFSAGSGYRSIRVASPANMGGVTAPVVYDDHIYYGSYSDRGYNSSGVGLVQPHEWCFLNAVRLVDDPSTAGTNEAGDPEWQYPDATYSGERKQGSGNDYEDEAFEAMKLCDTRHDMTSSLFDFLYPTVAGWTLNTDYDLHISGAARNYVPTVRTSPFWQDMTDSTTQLPVVGLARDSRSGLTVPTVFMNRAGGDLFALSCDGESFGWSLDISQEFTPHSVTIPANGTMATVLADQVTQTPAVGDPNQYFLRDSGGVLVATFNISRDSNNDITDVDLLIEPQYWREALLYTQVTIDYTLDVDNRRVQEIRSIFPRQRLLRADQWSGYGDSTKYNLLGMSTGAPLLLDADTVVSSSTALWLGRHQPEAKYESSSYTVDSGVGRGEGGASSPNAYQVRSSGILSFFDAAGESAVEGATNNNDYGTVRWVFDPGSVLPNHTGSLQSYLISRPTASGSGHLIPEPQSRDRLSFSGAPVKYGDTVVAVGQVRNSSHEPIAGAVIAVDPNPVLSAQVHNLTLDRTIPTYVVGWLPTGWAGNGLAAYIDADAATAGQQYATTDLRQFVIDPAQYTLDYSGNRVHFRADLAHLTKLAQPFPDSALTANDEPSPEAYRLPLYGRILWVIQDINRNGVYDGTPTDGLDLIYVPSPVRWMYLPYTVLLNARGIVDTSTVQVYRRGNPTALVQGTDWAINDTYRPEIMTILSGSTAVGAGDEVEVRYQLLNGTYQYSEYHVVPAPTPGFSSSPVVAGNSIFLSGSQLGTLASSSIPGTASSAGDAIANGGLYSFEYQPDGIVEMDRTFPETIPTWPNFDDSAAARSFVRGIPLALEDEVLVSFGLLGNGSGSAADAGKYIAPLYAIGGSYMLVTEAQRLARVDYEGRINWQLTGTKEKNAAQRPDEAVSNNPQPSELVTTLLSKPAKALNLPGDQVLIVDTGNDRVVQCDKTGLVNWPIDARINNPDGKLRYLGLRDFGLKRPTDVALFEFVGSQTHDWAEWADTNGDGNVDSNDLITKRGTLIADRGHNRLAVVVSYQRREPSTGITQTYYEPLRHSPEWALPAAANDRIGREWTVTAPQVYDRQAKQWITLPWVGAFPWDPQPGDGDALHDDRDLGSITNGRESQDAYFVAWAEGTDHIYNVHMDAAINGDDNTRNNGYYDDNNDGVVDGATKDLWDLRDEWSRTAGADGQFQTADDGWCVFRGLKYVRRYRRGGIPYLLLVQGNNSDQSQPMIGLYRYSGSDAASAPVTDPADGPLGTGLHLVWQFTRTNYRDLVYGTAANDGSYYDRAGVSLTQRYDRWYAGGQKQWNPVVARMFPDDNLLAIVNGAANSVNQAASNSELLLVRFDPNDWTTKRVEHLLPDLSTTSTYPAGQAASQRIPELGSYSISSPVEVHQ